MKDNESAYPFLVVFTDEEFDACEELGERISQLKKIGQKIRYGGPDFHERIKAYRGLKKDIFRYIAPFSLRRRDIQRDFQQHFKEHELYEDLGFYLVREPACYDPITSGWRIDSETAKESKGLFDF